MAGRLFLHIGPPKTATTALQYAFEEIADETLIYGGTFQPRERNAGSLSDMLLRATHGRSVKPDHSLEEALTRIREDVRSGKIVVVSEELLSLSMKTPMADKLAFLGQCFAGLPTTIILCIRDPQEAIPSLYQELYRNQPFLTKLSFSRFCRSQVVDCYDYRKIVTLLRQAGFDTILTISFEQICSGEMTSRDLFDHPGLPDKRLNLRKVNTSQTKGDGAIRQLEPLSLGMLGQTRILRKLRKLPPFSNDRVAGMLAAIAERIKIPNSDYRRLSIPQAQARHFEESYRFAQGLQAVCADQDGDATTRDRV